MIYNDIKFDSIVNARHLGGMTGSDGRRIKDNLLVRCGNLSAASDDDIDRLVNEFHISKVFDLRTPFEVENAANRSVPGSEYIHLSIIDVDSDMGRLMKPQEGEPVSIQDKLLKYVLEGKARSFSNGFYVSFVEDEFSQNRYRIFLKEIVNNDGDAVLWHCSQGKDRTGLAAAYLLWALGVSREDIIDDFEHSNAAYTKELDSVKEMVKGIGGTDIDVEIVQGLFGVNVKWFIAALDHIDSKFGGMDSYLRNQLDLQESDIEILKNRYLSEI